MSKTYGQALRHLRTAAGATQGQVARAIGVSVPYVSEVEHDRREPFSPTRIDYTKLAAVLGCTVTDLDELAARHKKSVTMHLENAAPEVRQAALLMARRVAEDAVPADLAAEIVERLKRIRQRLGEHPA